jgi:hypothetical protein
MIPIFEKRRKSQNEKQIEGITELVLSRATANLQAARVEDEHSKRVGHNRRLNGSILRQAKQHVPREVTHLTLSVERATKKVPHSCTHTKHKDNTLLLFY